MSTFKTGDRVRLNEAGLERDRRDGCIRQSKGTVISLVSFFGVGIQWDAGFIGYHPPEHLDLADVPQPVPPAVEGRDTCGEGPHQRLWTLFHRLWTKAGTTEYDKQEWKELEAEILRLFRSDRTHAGDCTIYAALHNGNPTDGICTCGYGLALMRQGDESAMYSRERRNA